MSPFGSTRSDVWIVCIEEKSNEMFEFVKNLSIGFMTSDGPIVYAEAKMKMLNL